MDREEVKRLTEYYRSIGDDALVEIYLQRSGYAAEAKEAMEAAISQRGGKQVFLAHAELVLKRKRETVEVKHKTAEWMAEKRNLEEIIQGIEVKYLSDEEKVELITEEYKRCRPGYDEVRIRPRSRWTMVLGGLAGGVAGSFVSFPGLLITGEVNFFTLVLPFLISVGFIWLLARQGFKNWLVILISAGGSLLSLLISLMLLGLLGYFGK